MHLLKAIILFKFVILVDKTLSTQTPYNGQVWLDDIDGSTLTPNPLLLYLNTEGSLERGHVCLPKQISSNKTMQLIADTVCRQLGYTNSPNFYIDTGYDTTEPQLT